MEFRRSGGIVAGNQLRTVVDLDELPGDQAAELAELLDQVDLADLARRSTDREPGPDTYQYDLTVDHGEESAHVTVYDTQVPSELLPVIKRLETRAVEERRRKR